MEAVQGKELERIYKEEGVIDEEDDEEPDNFEDSEEQLNLSVPDSQEGRKKIVYYKINICLISIYHQVGYLL